MILHGYKYRTAKTCIAISNNCNVLVVIIFIHHVSALSDSNKQINTQLEKRIIIYLTNDKRKNIRQRCYKYMWLCFASNLITFTTSKVLSCVTKHGLKQERAPRVNGSLYLSHRHRNNGDGRRCLPLMFAGRCAKVWTTELGERLSATEQILTHRAAASIVTGARAASKDGSHWFDDPRISAKNHFTVISNLCEKAWIKVRFLLREKTQFLCN